MQRTEARATQLRQLRQQRALALGLAVVAVCLVAWIRVRGPGSLAQSDRVEA